MCGDLLTSIGESFSDASAADIASVAGTAVTAGSQVVAAQAAAKELKRQAALTTRAGEFELESLRREEDRLKGRQRVAAAKAGVRGGSVLDVMRASALEAEEEALNIKFGAESGTQARLFEARQTARAGGLGAVGTILQGFGGR